MGGKGVRGVTGKSSGEVGYKGLLGRGLVVG